MRFIHTYVAWMILLMVARLMEIITKTVFESLFIIGIAFAAGATYKRLCEVHYAFNGRHNTCNN